MRQAESAAVTVGRANQVPQRARATSRSAYQSNHPHDGAGMAPRRRALARKAPFSQDGFPGFAQNWAPIFARTLLGLVLAWFGYHELVVPRLWTGYVPLLPATSTVSVVLVLAHGWAMLVLAAALVAGIAPRLAGSVAALLLAEIVISLTVAHGLSDLVLRDVGVLGLAVAVSGQAAPAFVLASPSRPRAQVRDQRRQREEPAASEVL
ncbi:MAG: hypothetical protein ACP5VR_02015 [Acidimicrobiales bacterium]